MKNVHGQFNSPSLARLGRYIDINNSIKEDGGDYLVYSNQTSVEGIKQSIKFDLGSEFSEWYDENSTTIPVPNLPYDNCFFAYDCGHDGLSYGVHLRIEDDLVRGDFFYSESDWKSCSPTPTVCVESDGHLIVKLDAVESYNMDYDSDAREMVNCRIALTGVLKSIEAMNCSNIISVEHKPTKLRAARASKKGRSLFSYHTLHITNEKNQKGPPSGGIHSSPRVHLRRGHIRTLPTGITTWVQPCVVGDKTKGIVHKDYSVRSVSDASSGKTEK